MTNYKNLHTFVVELCADIGSLYNNTYNDRRNIIAFLDTNQWFGITPNMDGKFPLIAEKDIGVLREPLLLWLSAYHRPERDKLRLLLKRFHNEYPATCELYKNFVSEHGLWDKAMAWKLFDFILCEIDKDITLYCEAELEGLIRLLNSQATRLMAKLFAEFISTCKVNGKPLSPWGYSFSTQENIDIIKEAYHVSDYSVMAYYIFNEEAWRKQDMIEKAVKSRSFADMWLYMAMHFICALRAVDMGRLPAPALSDDGTVLLKKIADGTFTRHESESLVDDLCIRLKLMPIKPSKTASHGNISDIKLFIAESLKAPLGIIMAIALAHNPDIRPGDSFITHPNRNSVRNISYVKTFFGEHFVKALGNRVFSSRRCNKSYLQGIEAIGGNESGKPKGYMLAALARSHKTGFGRLSETTEIYLKDACFNGYSPAFIIRQMFERGVFSFIPSALLEIYAGSEYLKLPIKSQTQLICELGLNAIQVDGLVEMVERAMIKSRKNVANIVKNKESVGTILQNIASGAAPARQEGCLCLMTAAGQICPYLRRNGCIGCGYEVYTKTTMYTLMREYKRLSESIKNTKTTDAKRYKKILEQAIFPAVTEMLASAKTLYPNADISGLLDIMEVEMNGSDFISRKN